MLASLSIGMSDFASSYIGKVQKLHTSNHINCKEKREAKIVQKWKKVKIKKKPNQTKTPPSPNPPNQHKKNP